MVSQWHYFSQFWTAWTSWFIADLVRVSELRLSELRRDRMGPKSTDSQHFCLVQVPIGSHGFM